MGRLERDRVFSLRKIYSLRGTGCAMLTTGSEVCGVCDSAISRLEGLVGQVPGEAKSSMLIQSLACVKRPLANPGHETLNISLDITLRKLMDNLPKIDSDAAGVMEMSIQSLKTGTAMIRELMGYIDLAGTNINCEAYSAELKKYMETWKETKFSLDQKMEKAQTILKGFPKYAAFDGDPVNMETGNFTYNYQDLSFRGAALFEFSRFYNALDKAKGDMGRGWMHNWESSLLISQDKVILTHEDGREEIFEKIDGNTYRSNQDKESELKRIEDVYGYRRQDGLICFYNGEGQLFRVTNNDETEIVLLYENGKLVKVQAVTGESLLFAYNERKLLSEVVDHTGRKVTFSYDKSKLTGVTDPLGYTIHYYYGKNGRIEQITDKRDVSVLKNSYDEHRRIIAQEFPDGGVIKFRYLDGKNRIYITEQNGNEITYVCDEQFRNIRTDYEDGSELYSYDEHNRCTSYTDKRRNTTTYSYDKNGRLIAVTDALHNQRTAVYDQKGRLTMQIEADGGNTNYSYDKRGRLVAITDPVGNTLRFTYDGKKRQPVNLCFPDGGEMHLTYDQKGNIISIVNPEGDEERYEYDGLGRVVQSSDGNGNKVRYVYDKMDRLVEVTRQDGKKRIYEYNEMGEAAQIVDFDGYSMQWEYNVLNKPKCYTDKEGRDTFMEYDLTWMLSKVVDPEGGVTAYTYDHLKRLTAITDSTGSRVCFTYDANGNQTSVRYPDESVAYFEYDALNRKVSETDEKGGITRTFYDSVGRITRVVDPAGGETCYEYDRTGNKISEKDASGAITTYEYTSLGKPKAITYPTGRVEKYYYQPGGRLLKKEYGDGTWEKYDYDHAGNVLSIDRQDGSQTTYDYDCLNRVVQIRQNGEVENRYTYDALGNVSMMEDACGNQTHYRYSPEGNLTGVTDPEGNRVIYTYNGRNELMGILQLTAEDVIEYMQISPAGQEQIPDYELWEVMMLNKQNNPLHLTLFERNSSGQIETVTDGLGQKESYRYDVMGRVISRTDREGKVSTFRYYPGGELEEAAYPDGKKVLLSYDALNRLNRIKDWLGETVFDYDEVGRITETVDHKGDTFRYGWNPDGSRDWLEYPDGSKIHYTYDDKARLMQIVCGDFRIDYNYDENSRIKECRRGNGVISRLRYNQAGQVEEIVHTKGAELLEHFVYNFDSLGNPVRIKRESQNANCSYTHEFAYDGNNRLTTIRSDGGLIRQYQYDGYGNRISAAEISEGEQGNCSMTAYRYNPLNQLAGMGDEEYTHTLNGGRQYGLGKDGQAYCYEYDSMGHLKGIICKGEYLQENEYNGLGHRVITRDKTNSAYNATIGYTIDYTNEYARIFTEKGRQERKYLWQDNDLCGMPEEESYVLTDALHTPICVTDREGKPHNAYCYNEFGVLEYKKEEIPLPFGFTGYPKERIDNLYYAGAREYDSTAGNFLTRDLLYYMDFEKPNTLNLYQYVQGNPLRYVDYSGHACIEERDYYANMQQNSLRNLNWRMESALGQRKRDDFKITGADLIEDNNVQTLKCANVDNSMQIEGDIASSGTNIVANGAMKIAPMVFGLVSALKQKPVQTLGEMAFGLHFLVMRQMPQEVQQIDYALTKNCTAIIKTGKNAIDVLIKNIPVIVENELVIDVYETWRKSTHMPNWLSQLVPEALSVVPEEVSEQNAAANVKVFEEQKELKEIADEARKNGEQNKEVEEQIFYKEGEYIENQEQWGEVKFGSKEDINMSTSGCGVMATYNALLALGEDVSSQTMVEMISEFEKEALGGGAYGVSPGAVYDYFKDREYEVHMTYSTDSEVINSLGEQSDTIIVTAYNDKNNIYEMVHNVSITKNDAGKYEIHNAYYKDGDQFVCNNNNGEGYDTVQEAIDGMGSGNAKDICVIGISNPETDE